jgi:hypothetical protein
MQYEFLTKWVLRHQLRRHERYSQGWIKTSGKELVSISPIDGKPIAR